MTTVLISSSTVIFIKKINDVTAKNVSTNLKKTDENSENMRKKWQAKWHAKNEKGKKSFEIKWYAAKSGAENQAYKRHLF